MPPHRLRGWPRVTPFCAKKTTFTTPWRAEDVCGALSYIQEERVLREELRALKEEEAARVLGRRAYSPALGADTPTPLPPFRRWGSALTPEDAHPRYGVPSPAQ